MILFGGNLNSQSSGPCDILVMDMHEKLNLKIHTY